MHTKNAPLGAFFVFSARWHNKYLAMHNKDMVRKKAIKKSIVALFFLLLLLLFIAACASAHSEPQSLSEFLERFTKALYENADLETTHNLSRYIEGDSLGIYLSEKAAIHQLVTEKAYLHKENYHMEIEPLTAVNLDEKTYFVSLAVRVSFNYVGLGETESGYGEILDLVIAEKNGSYKVLDLYAQHNYYDTDLRGCNLNLREAWKGKQGLQSIDPAEIAKRAEELKIRLEAYYD